MATFEINKNTGDASAYRATVTAAQYRQEQDYFVFYADPSRTKKVLTIKADAVTTIDTVSQ